MISKADILRGKVLIVDDQEANVLLLEKLLRGAGYQSIESTTDSSKVTELHLVNHYDLILLDLQMPGMDGFQVMENLQQIETGGYIPVLVITAQPEHKVRALKAGARDFVSKPFDLSEVLARVHNMLEVRLLHRETKRLYQRVIAEQKVSERLVTEVPRAIGGHLNPPVEAMPPGPGLVTESSAEVMVLFSDIMEFTRFSEGASAPVLVGVLDAISARFDAQPDAGTFDRTTAIGYAYLAAAGLPDAVANHSIRAANKALDLTEAMDRFNGHSRCKLKVRIGLDGDEPVARRKQRFDL
jgi:adenylate cyclase